MMGASLRVERGGLLRAAEHCCRSPAYESETGALEQAPARTVQTRKLALPLIRPILAFVSESGGRNP